MEHKKGLNFFLLMIAIITGGKVIKHFDYHNFSFEKPALDTVYLIAFLVSIVVLVKDYIKK